MSVVLALVAAAAWGTSDFFGGLAGRRAGDRSTLRIVFVSQAIGVVPILALALVVAGRATSRDLGLGAVSGIVGMLAVGLLYRGLRVGKMGLVAPITGAVAAGIPVVVSVVRGELPSALAWAGIATAILAIVLVSTERPDPGVVRVSRIPPGIAEALAAGVGFGGIFLLLDLTGEASGVIPLVALRLVGTAVVAVVALAAGHGLTAPPGTGWLLVTVGLLDATAVTAYLFATRAGLLALVAVIASLYPVATVLWARIRLREDLARHQRGGLVLALVAVVLLTLS